MVWYTVFLRKMVKEHGFWCSDAASESWDFDDEASAMEFFGQCDPRKDFMDEKAAGGQYRVMDAGYEYSVCKIDDEEDEFGDDIASKGYTWDDYEAEVLSE